MENDILSILESIGQNLKAVESARQQVDRNVAAYAQINQQLSDTSSNLRKMVDSISNYNKELDRQKTSIIKELSDLKDVLILKFREETGKIEKQLSEAPTKVIDDLNIVITTITNSLDKISSNFNEHFEKRINDFGLSVSNHLAEYREAETVLKKDIQDLEKQNQLLATTTSNLANQVGEKVEGIMPGITNLFEEQKNLTNTLKNEIGNLISDNTTEIKESTQFLNTAIETSISKNKENLKGSHDATKRSLEKIEGRILEDTSNLKKDIKGSHEATKKRLEGIEEQISKNNDSVKEEISDLKKNNKNYALWNGILTGIVIILLILFSIIKV